MKIFKVAVLLLVLSPGVTSLPAQQTNTNAFAVQAETITPAFITALSEEARTNHLALRALAARIDAAKANEAGIRRWQDPMARVGQMAADDMMRREEGDLLFGVEQKLPVFGRPKAARDVARSQTGVADAEADLRFQQLRKDIAQVVFRLGLAQRVVELGEQEVQWLGDIQTATEQRYETGESAQFEVLQAQNERARRATQLKTDAALVWNDRVTLNRLLNRQPTSSWPRLHLPEIAGPIVFSERLAQIALTHEPELKVRRRQIAEAESMAEATRRERYPEMSVGAEVRAYSENPELRQGMVTFSFSIPWGNRKRYEADYRRDKERAKAVQLEAADYELSVRTEIHNLITRIDAARRQALLYRDEIIPRSQTAFESTRFSWESGRSSFNDLLAARRMVVEAQLSHATAVAQQYELLSELVLCCGLGDLEALHMIGAIPEEPTENQNQK